MKFKKEDAGLYFAFMLIGGGLGMLAGAILANWIEKRKELVGAEDPGTKGPAASDQDWAKAQRAKIEQELAEQRKEHAEVMSRGYKAGAWVAPVKKETVGKPRKKNEKRPNLSKYSDEELEEFFAEFPVNYFQMEMLRNGSMTMEQVQGVLELEQEALEMEPEDYSAPYRTAFEIAKEEAKFEGMDKVQLEYIIEELGIINGKFRVLASPPVNANELPTKEIQWDPEDDAFYYLRRGQPILYNIQTTIGRETWDEIIPYMLGNVTDIWVEDVENSKLYAFHKLVGIGEDEPVDDFEDESD